jgi:GntR family transcriptional regulator, vanillate catabolism transcriptional regulator
VITVTRRTPPRRIGAQTGKAHSALKRLLLEGQLAPGEYLSEALMVERLGVSRTPARMAMIRLADEGLLTALASGGYSVRGFSQADVLSAIEIRGIFEGLAARFAAERHLSEEDLRPLKDCVSTLDGVIERPGPMEELIAGYAIWNERFHRLLSELAASPDVLRQIDRATALPFATPGALLMARAVVSEPRSMLIVAQDQHHSILEAVEKRDGARAENLVREHARLASRTLSRVLHDPRAFCLVPGSALIRLDVHDR